MKKDSRTLFACCVLVAVAIVGAYFLTHSTNSGRNVPNASVNRFDGQATRSQVYILAANSWLEFPIPQQAADLRTVTNAVLPPDAARDPASFDRRPGWTYAIEFRALDHSDKVVRAGVYHFRVQLHELRDPVTGETFFPSFFRDSDLVPSKTQDFRLPLEQLPEGQYRWQLRLAEKSKGVVDVCVRVYVREERPNFNAPFAWQRISKERREKLCRATVYGAELMSLTERRNLLHWTWNAIVPIDRKLGEIGQRFIYTRDDIDAEETGGSEYSPGIELDVDRWATIPMPPDHARFRLEFAHGRNPGTGDSHHPTIVSVRWFGDRSQARREYQWTVSEDDESFSIDETDGLLEVRADGNLFARVFATPSVEAIEKRNSAEPTEVEILPDASYVRTFYVAPNQPIEYSLSHVGELSVPFCLAVRRIPRPPSTDSADAIVDEAPGRIRWQFLNGSGDEIASGERAVDDPWSPYDRVSTMLADNRVSEAKKAYFAVGPTVRRVRVQAMDGPMLVTAYTRPPDSPRITCVPDDYQAIARGAIGSRSWFLVRPDDHSRLLEAGRGWSLRVQPRPPDDRQQGQPADVEWDSLVPNGLWVARPLLVPRDPSLPMRDQSRRTIYCELPINQELAVRFAELTTAPFQPRLIYTVRGSDCRRTDFNPLGESGINSALRGQTDSRAVYHRDDDQVRRCKLLVDGKPFHEAELRAAQGEIDLPQLPVSAHQSMTVRADRAGALRVFLNGVDAPGRPLYMKRLAQRLGDGPLEFTYQKVSPDSESLTLNVYLSDQAAETIHVRVRIDIPDRPTNRPGSGWTFADRLFEIRLGTPGASLVLGANGEQVDSGQACHFSLDEDLPPGAYTIRVEQLDGEPGYAVLTRTAIGSSFNYEAWRETDDIISEQ